MNSPQACRPLVVACLGFALVLLSPPGASADSLSGKQRKLNDDAVEAMIDGDHEKAVELLQQSLDLGELNVTWLNLGRAYAKLGRCEDALSAYDRMAVAPRVSEPPPEVLYDVLTEYRAELLETCSGRVLVRCSPADLQVRIDEDDPIACPNAEVELGAGTHKLVALDEGGNPVQERIVEVEGMSVTYVDLAAAHAPEKLPEAGPRADPVFRDALYGIGWASFGVGLAALVAGAVVDGGVLVPTIDEMDGALADGDITRAADLREEARTLQGTAVGLYAAGGTLAAVGAAAVLTVLLVDGGAEQPSTEPTAGAFRFTVAPSSTGFSTGVVTHF